MNLLRGFSLIFISYLLVIVPGLVINGAVAADLGLLWRVEASGVAPSFLFGTIHSEDPRVTTLPEPVSHALEEANLLLLEVVPNEDALRTIRQAMFLPKNESLQQIIGTLDFNRTTKALTNHGFPPTLAERLKPWAAAIILELPPSHTGLILDLVLYSRALRRNMSVVGLERASEQSAVFDDLSMVEQVELLRETLNQLTHQDRLFAELHEAYLSRDLERLEVLSKTYSQFSNRKLGRKIMDRLLEQRNRRMAERMDPYLRQGGIFIAVGALHLAGKTGLIERLRACDYRVTAVY